MFLDLGSRMLRILTFLVVLQQEPFIVPLLFEDLLEVELSAGVPGLLPHVGVVDEGVGGLPPNVIIFAVGLLDLLQVPILLARPDAPDGVCGDVLHQQ